LYFVSSDSENEDISSDHNSNKETTNRIEAMKRMKEGRVVTTMKGSMEGTIKITKMKVTNENLPFGHICDDIVIDNDTPYMRRTGVN
jgi:hypothetical protein